MKALFEPYDVSTCFEDLQEIERVENSKQSVLLFRHKRLGKILVIDDEVQHVEAWAEFYHEPLVHLPIAFIPNISSVLILGGGSLFAANECLKYKTLKNVTLVDWDEETLALVRRHYDHAAHASSDKRLVHVCDDARQYLHKSSDTFDLIINDCCDLSLIDEYNAYLLAEHRLTQGGLCSDILYRDVYHTDTIKRSIEAIGATSYRKFSLRFVPDYPGVVHLQALWGTNSRILYPDSQSLNHEQYTISYGYFDPNRLDYFLYLPNKMKDWISDITENFS